MSRKKYNKRSLENVKIKFESCGLKLLDTEYLNASTKMKAQTHSGYLVECSLTSIINNKPYIYHKSNKYSIHNIQLYLKLSKSKYKLKPEQIYMGDEHKLIFICPICGEFEQKFSTVKCNAGRCCYCNNRKIKIGFNDINTTDPDKVKYFKFKSDAFKNTRGSGNRCAFVCPFCGHEKTMSILNLIRYKFCCDKCADGISIPNKFLLSIFNQLNFKTKRENIFSNSKYRYDLYVETETQNYTIEAHGEQHFSDIAYYKSSLKNQQKIDDDKMLFSESLGNVHIEVDCRKSDFQYLKEQFEVALNNYFDLSTINWKKVFKDCSNSRLVEICVLYNSCKDVNQISIEKNINYNVIRTYLIKGNKMGLCNYDKAFNIKNKPRLYKKVYQYTTDGVFIREFNSRKEASELTGCHGSAITNCCNGKIKHTKGFLWRYTKE